jgi:hypothetical protein
MLLKLRRLSKKKTASLENVLLFFNKKYQNNFRPHQI